VILLEYGFTFSLFLVTNRDLNCNCKRETRRIWLAKLSITVLVDPYSDARGHARVAL
jgi:hypothetical protein